MQIRTKRVQNNAGGRAGCQFQSPFTNQIYYASVEHGTLYLRHYDGHELAKEQGVALLPSGGVSACFASPGMVCVTVAGFEANADNSGMDTYVLPLVES
jgi:hypothetical protein